MPAAVISGYVRTPFTVAGKGELAPVRPDELLASAVSGLIKATGAKPSDIEDLIAGCAFPEGEQGMNIARMAVFLSGLPVGIAGATVNRFCGSSMEAIHMAAGAIAMGAGNLFIAAGVESMSRIPMMGFNFMPNVRLMKETAGIYSSMGETAENVARKWNISRQAQENFAVQSHLKASAARKTDKFINEIIPVSLNDGSNRTVALDGCIRVDTTLEKMATLNPAFVENGTVTAATSSPVTDGAAAVLVASEPYARAVGLPIFARIRSIAVSGCAPEIMGIGPVVATHKALDRTGLRIDEIDVIELNEAFASQALACVQELNINTEKLNIDGGALALGHPLGATGARITGKAAQILHREGLRYALATQCIGGGQGIATVLESCHK